MITDEMLEVVGIIKSSPDGKDKEVARKYFKKYLKELEERMQKQELKRAEEVAEILEAIMSAIPEKAGNKLQQHLVLSKPVREKIAHLMHIAKGNEWEEIRIALQNVLLLSMQALLVRNAGNHVHNIKHFEDLISAANLELLEKAFEKYDYEKGKNFITYGYSWIRKGFQKYRARNVQPFSLPPALITKWGQEEDDDGTRVSHISIHKEDDEGHTIAENLPDYRASNIEDELEQEYKMQEFYETISMLPYEIYSFIEEELDEPLNISPYDNLDVKIEILNKSVYIGMYIKKLKEEKKNKITGKLRQSKRNRMNKMMFDDND